MSVGFPQRRWSRRGSIRAAVCVLLISVSASASGGGGAELALKLAQVAAVGGFAVYDGAATLTQQRSSPVLLLQTGVVTPLAVVSGVRAANGDVRPDAQAFWLLTDALMNQQVLFGASGALHAPGRLPELYALTWAGGIDVAGTLLLAGSDAGPSDATRIMLATNAVLQAGSVGTLLATGTLGLESPGWLWTAAPCAAWAVGLGVWALLAERGDLARARSEVTRWRWGLSPLTASTRGAPSGALLHVTGSL